MKAAVFEKAHTLSVVQKPLRAILPNEVLVRVQSCGVWGTDVHIFKGESRSTPPVILGHEYSGTIEETAGQRA